MRQEPNNLRSQPIGDPTLTASSQDQSPRRRMVEDLEWFLAANLSQATTFPQSLGGDGAVLRLVPVLPTHRPVPRAVYSGLAGRTSMEWRPC
jgi:hypothetical protein